jgi:hypothetical protein
VADLDQIIQDVRPNMAVLAAVTAELYHPHAG